MASWEVCIDSMGHSIRVAEGRGGGWLLGRYALTPWDTATELLKVGGGRVASWEVCIDSMGHSIRVAEGRGGGWLHGRYALTPWDTASELLKVEGEGGFMGGMH